MQLRLDAVVVAFLFYFIFTLIERNDDRKYARMRGLASRPLALLKINGLPCFREAPR